MSSYKSWIGLNVEQDLLLAIFKENIDHTAEHISNFKHRYNNNNNKNMICILGISFWLENLKRAAKANSKLL